MVSIGDLHLTPGYYGPFPITGLTRQNTRSLKLTVTQTTPWPDLARCCIMTLAWDTGDKGIFYVPGVWRRRGSPDRVLTTYFEFTTPPGDFTRGEFSIEALTTIDFNAMLDATAF